MAHPRTRARLMLLLLGLLLAAALVWFQSGCASSGFLDRLLGGGSTKVGNAGDDLPNLLSGAADSFAKLDWWLGLGAGVSILVGVYRALRGDLAGGGAAVGIGIGLILINALVAVLLPVAFIGVAVVTGILALVVGYRLATGRGIGGHSLRCLVGHLRGTNPHKRKRKAPEVTP